MWYNGLLLCNRLSFTKSVTIVFATHNLKSEYGQLCERSIWDYKYTTVQPINCGNESFDWKKPR